eukprot:TRINITY_DN6285_c0_g5_i1.p1 TRINITY_DN6285_c0_g5~~TRINITY_DN6285_c0_g5_i1.p1  ORF type:complete len:297 (-),score=53.33 TRINITY_DN6285_c0_g5_i1:115-1005(-)
MTDKYPVDLILVRHGESEGNLAQEFSNNGDDSLWTEEFRQRHTSKYRLTEKGRLQAQVTGEFIRKYVSPQFDRYYTSEYTRAMETASLLGFTNSEWLVEFYLRERDVGVLGGKSKQERNQEFRSEIERRKRDWFYFQPPGGESIANCCLRVDRWLSDLRGSCTGLRIIAVCHGNILTAVRIRLENLKQEEYSLMKTDPLQKTYNAHLLHYTRRDPFSGTVHSNFNWLRSICPWDTTKSSNIWQTINRRSSKTSDLLESVEKIPRLHTNQQEQLENFKKQMEQNSRKNEEVGRLSKR